MFGKALRPTQNHVRIDVKDERIKTVAGRKQIMPRMVLRVR